MRFWQKINFYISCLTVAVLALPVFNYLTEWAEPNQRTPATEAVAVAEQVVHTEEAPAEVAEPADAGLFLLRFPVVGAGVANIISYYGDPRGSKRLHEGVDIKAERGRPVLAALPGEVHRVRTGGAGGKQVWLKVKVRERDLQLYYAHLDRQLVKEGQQIQAGDVLGTVGSTGNATTPHLHFCIYTMDREAIDPLPYLSRVAVQP